ncbi:ATP-grasp domain-containing protein [Methanobacterium alcaliphilum]|uniref:ATP-grasp domain-containing protein n=1 Tax=Methanobacterium alcaliphilum TaxID=392018 RepID=UPI00200B7E3A|nr:ATP-grasp domain-containing protein [Methanobacterium alcaliphilum]MCK9150974.1 ATP-grasp domain-containing protein [Methanobacterium alcaliphilum]
MEKLLILGVNTRPLSCSAQKLGYIIYSASYFATKDFNCYYKEKHILHQKPNNSCGYFAHSYSEADLKSLCVEWIDEVDHIITYTGISPENFSSSKILGNIKIENIENKFQLHKKLKKKFNVPETFLLSDIDEAHEINQQYPEKEFLIKPIKGSGGYGIKKLDEILYENVSFSEEFILQEFISGENVSASILSTGKEAKPLISSRQIIGEGCSGPGSEFIYCGNITPYPGDAENMKKIACNVVEELSLIGSNGVDMIIKDDEIHIVEVNPRIQGTFECAEASLGINLMEAHINACNGKLMKINEPEQFAIKKILYAPQRCMVGEVNFKGVYDLPLKSAIIEKGEPIVTLLNCGKTPAEVIKKTNDLINKVKKNLVPLK